MNEPFEIAHDEDNPKEALALIDSIQIRNAWEKALNRSKLDPEGAITSARTLIESTCKHILDFRGIEYQITSDLPALYSKTAHCLELAPSQQSEQIFRRILGSCQSMVEGLGALRNRLGDAHGRGQEKVLLDTKHAILAVELAGALATYLIKTHEAEIKRKTWHELTEPERQELLEVWLEVATEKNLSDPGRLPYTESLIVIQRKFFSHTSIFVPEGEIFHFLVNQRKAKKLPRPNQEK